MLSSKQSLIIRYQNSWRNCWQSLEWRAWSSTVVKCNNVWLWLILRFSFEDNCSACDIIIQQKVWTLPAVFFGSFSFMWRKQNLHILLISASLCKKPLWKPLSHYMTLKHTQDSVIAVWVLLSTSNWNGTGSMEVLRFSSLLYRGVLFNGASLLAQLGSKMVCKCSFCPGSSFLINARMAIIRIPLWVKTDSYNIDSALIERLWEWQWVLSLNSLLNVNIWNMRQWDVLGFFFLSIQFGGKMSSSVSFSKMAASSLVASELPNVLIVRRAHLDDRFTVTNWLLNRVRL